jgi:hypothetical protein
MEVNEVLHLIESGTLGRESELLLLSKLIGYTSMPPTIEEFIFDDYYCGRFFGDKVFKHWVNMLYNIFPDPIHQPYPYLCLTGALGAGKTTASKICEMYIDCKLDHLRDFSFSALADTKPLVASFFHTNKGKALKEFVSSISTLRSRSPYFTQGRLGGVSMGMAVDGTRGNSAIGDDVLFYSMSELNFVKKSVAKSKITQAHHRNKSRYQKILGYFPMIILDSSADAENSVVDEFINNNPYDGVWVDRSSIWEAKAGLGIYFNKGSFKVYKGDSQNRPHIIQDDEDVSILDRDRILDVPKELEPDFRANLIQALMDMGGVSVSTAEKYIQDITYVDRQCCLHDYIPDPIYVEFSDLEDDIYSKVEDVLKILPKNKIIFISLDAAIHNDLYGIGMGYVDRLFEVPNTVDGAQNRIYYPIVNIPIVFGVSRYATQYTSITHVAKFILAVRDAGWEIGAVTCDQYQSEQLLQDLIRAGIRAYKISTDRTDVPYSRFKNGLYRSFVFMPDSPILKAELKRLKVVNGKIDGPREEVNGITTHKDFSDVVCRCYCSILDNQDLATQVPSNVSINEQIEATKRIIENKSNNTINNLLRSIYG